VDHALSCHCGGFPSIRLNELRDLTAHLLTEVCSNVGVEPALQPLGGERMDHRTANSEDNARLDIKADNFWSRDRGSFTPLVFSASGGIGPTARVLSSIRTWPP